MTTTTTTGYCSPYYGRYGYNDGTTEDSDCGDDDSTFFIVLGFAMLVVVLFLFLVVIIACVRKYRQRVRAQQLAIAAQVNPDDCIVVVDGAAESDGSRSGGDVEAVKTVIMAGEEKPTFIAHPVRPSAPSSPPSSPPLEESEVSDPELESHSAESSTRLQP